MHIRQLECFIHLAETLSFSRTAELLYITQPSVTNQVNTLEDELNLKLFIRSKRKVELTPTGVSFYNDLKDIMTKLNIAIAKAKNYSETFESNISIGYEGNVEDSPLITYTMIKGKLGIAVMPDFVCPEDSELSIIPMDINDSISYGIAWHKNNERKDIKGFVAIAKEIYKLQNVE